ncbi:hypothetical protein C4K87_001491 [Salmonella enterica subsp. diarizonae serovar 50:r:z]|nr:hypothetical protein [Salmonella enterica subsp. diarizonae serovar 50:r:z]
MSNNKFERKEEVYVHLSEFAEITMGQSPDSSGYNTNQKGLPFLQGCAEFGRRSPTAKVYCNPPLRISKPDSILISVRAPVGTLNWGDDKYCIGRGLSAIRARQGIADTKFLSYAILNKVDFLHRRSQGSTFLAISASDLRILPIPKFDLESQQNISKIIQSIDDAIEKTEVLIDKYNNIKYGMMYDLFTRGISSNGKLREKPSKVPHLYRNTVLGVLPNEWEILDLKSVFGAGNIVNGPFGSDLLTSELKSEGVPVIYCQDIRPGVFSKVSKAYVTLQKAAQLAFCSVRTGDIILSKVGSPPCDSCVYDSIDNAIVTQDVIRIRPSSDHNSSFFSAWFCSEFGRSAIRKISIEGTRERVSLGDFKSLLLPIPNKEEQDRIGIKLSCIDNKINISKRYLEQLKYKRLGLIDDLLSKKVTVEKKITKSEATNV